jgi:hypothetical protein
LHLPVNNNADAFEILLNSGQNPDPPRRTQQVMIRVTAVGKKNIFI